MSPMVSADGWPKGCADRWRSARSTRRTLLGKAGWLAFGGAISTLTGCRGNRVVAPPPATTGALAERYVRLTLQLAKHQPSLVEVWLGPKAWAEGTRVPVPQLRTDVAALRHAIEDGRADTTARRVYLRGQIRALDAVAGRLLGESQSFADEARAMFGQVLPPRDAAAFDAVREQLSAALPGPGSLAERHAAFRSTMAVPATRIEVVFAAAVNWCRSATRERLPLPAGESLTTRLSDESGWEAFSRPVGPRASDLWVSRRASADAAHLLQLAAHEGTPGHHAQHVLAMATLVDGQGWMERALTPSFGPHRLLAEGAAEAGADLLLPREVREQVCREVLMPAAGQSPAAAARLVRIERLAADLGMEVAYIASDYLDSALSTETVAARLRDDALVLDPGGMVAFLEKQRTRVLAYPLGRQLVDQALTATPEPQRWARFAAISTTLTTAG